MDVNVWLLLIFFCLLWLRCYYIIIIIIALCIELYYLSAFISPLNVPGV